MLEFIFNLFQDIKWYNVKHKGSHEFGTITDFSVLEMQFYSMFLLSCLGMYSRGSIIMYCLITSFMVHVYCCSFLWHLGHGFFSHQYQRAGGRKKKERIAYKTSPTSARFPISTCAVTLRGHA